MSRYDFVGDGFDVVDVNGSFERFIREAPKVARQHMSSAVALTAFALSRRMEAKAPYGPDAPHIRENIAYTVRGLTAQVGFLEGKGGDTPSRDPAETWKGQTVTNAWVAMFNEYSPDKQPFMKPAAEEEARDFRKRMEAACGLIERSLATTESLSGESTVTFEGVGSRGLPRGTGATKGFDLGKAGRGGVFGTIR